MRSARFDQSFGVVCGWHLHLPMFFWKTLQAGDVVLELLLTSRFGFVLWARNIWVDPRYRYGCFVAASAPSPIARMWQGRAVGEKFTLARSRTSVTRPNSLVLPFFCLVPVRTPSLEGRAEMPSLCLRWCKLGFPTPVWHWGRLVAPH